MALQKKSILIATPGQTEQEYLAKHLHQQNKCISYKQNTLNIAEAIELAQSFQYNFSAINNFNETKLIELINELLQHKHSSNKANQSL